MPDGRKSLYRLRWTYLLVSYVPLASMHKREALAVDAAACPLRQANSLVTHTARLLSTTERANRIGASLQLN